MIENLLGIPETRLPEDPAAVLLADESADVKAVAGAHPASSLSWAILAEQSLNDDPVASYAYARTGYHRGLDALRRSGWRGQGPIPWSHEPNRGFLRALAALARAAREIGEQDEYERCFGFLRESSLEGAEALGL